MRRIYAVERPAQATDEVWTMLQDHYGEACVILAEGASEGESLDLCLNQLTERLYGDGYDPSTDWVLYAGPISMALLLVLAAGDMARGQGMMKMNVLLWSPRHQAVRPVSLPTMNAVPRMLGKPSHLNGEIA